MDKLRIHWKITILSFGLVLFSLLIGGIIILGSVARLREDELGRRVMITARTVADLPVVQEYVGAPDGWKQIAPIADNIRIINDVAYIVVLDMNRNRLSHPIWARIGEKFEDADADAAFAEHTYLSRASGEAGTAVRAYVPVIDEQHRQVGVVVAGQLLPTLGEMISNQRHFIIVTMLLSLSFGIWGSWQLARHIKRQMFNLEPQEIARMFRERSAAFQAMHEGVVAIDTKENITIFNDRAKQIFGISGDVIGLPIRDVLPDTRLPEILEQKTPVYNRELRVGNALIWSNRIPISEQQQTIGALAIFQDRTEVTRMAEELTGVRAFVDALRVQNHEYMNKLHTIAGLIQLDKKEQALQYVFEVSEYQEELSGFLQEHFCSDSIAGLLLSKISRGKELGIHVELDRRSGIKRFPADLDHHDLVIVIGNLVENAFDALATAEQDRKEVYVSIEQDDEVLSVLVEDNGIGMTEETKARMLEQGYSTKQSENRGVGLHLVNRIVQKAAGELRCESSPGQGASFMISFPMRGGRDCDGSADVPGRSH
ncbi:sensor histidine kinase [Paenibacillus alkalitolerans]|uniref:sensor histidine kinase n=1 Tax=Paenibacillus alkalitolerans TaxID=2799335 RepID=UPI002D80A1A0|nr:sensor histidine kinase [Paenibacillus alkalitolerans]